MISIASRWLCTVWRARPSAAAARETSSWPPLCREDVLEKGVEAVDVAEAEEALDVASEERVEPLAVERRALRFREQGLREAAVEEALLQRRAEGVELVPEHRYEVDVSLAAGQRVAELLAGGERRRARREDPELRKEVRADLQDAGGVLQLVDLVEDDDGPAGRAKEDGRVTDHLLGDRQGRS